jgi:glycosyltransferase involved in cell wall biosynthesis
MKSASAATEYNIVVAHYQSDVVSGAENSIADLVDQLGPRFQVTMLIPKEGNLAKFFRNRGFRVWVRQVETPRRLFPGLHQLQSRLLARELKRRRVNVILCNTFPAASRVASACQMAHLPYAIYMRDYISDLPLHRRILSQANVLLAISKDVIDQHAHMTGAYKFRLAYNFINPDPILDRYEAHLASGRRLLPFEPRHPVVGLVGRITPYKQPELFIRAIPHVLRDVPDARFVLIGAAQPREKSYEMQVKRLAVELGIENQVMFLGQRWDAIELASEFTISCLASGREPLGRVILEANLLGVPVIVPDTGGPAEIVEDRITGLHFPSQSPDAEILLAQQIIRMLKDPDLRDCLAAKARERVMMTFASQKHVRIQEEYFEQLCGMHDHA